MKHALEQLRLSFLSMVLALSVAGCGGQYAASTNKDATFNTHVNRLFIWSGIENVTPLTRKLPLTDDTFTNFFHTALKKNFSEKGVMNELKSFTPETDSLNDLARFEGKFAPAYRLIITPSKYSTITSTYYNKTLVDKMYLDLSLI